MKNHIFLGVWRFMLPVSEAALHKHVTDDAGGQAESPALAFMTADQRRVRNFVVSELPRVAVPLSPELIAGRLDLPVEGVVVLLDDLEKHLTFLFRNPQGAVEWAYPVTVARTPHKVTFSSGEKLYAA
jgi:16S rRNA U516 pseudouridylate synthase RsuA-like enzyme